MHHFFTPSLQMVWITFSSLSVLVYSAPSPWGRSLENCPEYQYLAFHSLPKPCFTPSFHSPRQISSILYSSSMLMLFLSPLFKKSQIFLTGWNRSMLAPLKLMPSPLGCAFWKKPSKQQLSMEQMPQPSQSPSRNCPVQQLVLPHPSYLSSLKYPSYAMLPFAEYSSPNPFLRDRLISPSYTTVLLSVMILQPSMECPVILSALIIQSPMRISCMDCSSSVGKEGRDYIFLGLDCYSLRGSPILMKQFNIKNYAQQTCHHPMKPQDAEHYQKTGIFQPTACGGSSLYAADYLSIIQSLSIEPWAA